MSLNIVNLMEQLDIQISNITPGLVINKLITDCDLECDVKQLRIQEALDIVSKPIKRQFSYAYVNLVSNNTLVNSNRLGTANISVNEALLSVANESLISNGLLIIETKTHIDSLLARLEKFKSYKNLSLDNSNILTFVKTNRSIRNNILLPTNNKPINELYGSSTLNKINKIDKIRTFKPTKQIERLKYSYPINIKDINLYWVIREGDKFLKKETSEVYVVTRVTYKSDYDPPIIEGTKDVT